MPEKQKHEMDDLWASYKATGDERAREGLILHYLTACEVRRR